MPLLQRVQDILIRPRETWPVIAAEPADTASLFSGYVAPLAAIPAVAGFIGLSMIGSIGLHIPMVSGLFSMVIGFVLSLLMVFVLAQLVDALAPTFGGTRDPLKALKLVAYASTAGFVGGIFSLLPMLSILGLLASLYSIYLIYTGLPVLMRCPADRAVPYTAVVVVCGIVATVVLAALTAMVVPSPSMHVGERPDAAGASTAATVAAPVAPAPRATPKTVVAGLGLAQIEVPMGAAKP